MQTVEFVVIVNVDVHVVVNAVKKDAVLKVRYMYKQKLLYGAGILSKKDIELAISLGCKGVVVSGK